MDTSGTYIKMCDCEEIQRNHQWRDGDVWGYIHSDGTVESDWYNQQLAEEYLQKMDDLIWLPTQSQLQEMVDTGGVLAEYRTYSLLTLLRFSMWDSKDLVNPYFRDFASMEQLWLAFVMKERHNKVWDSDIWLIT